MAERVLIVDDEANMRWVLKEALGVAGYEVEVAASGQEALHEMGRCPVDLVLLDLKLKGMDGLATLRRLMERWPEAVVIILTAYGTVATAVEAMQLGAADYLRKPFDVEEIGFKIQRALERRALQGEVRRLRARDDIVPASPAGAHVAWQRCVEQVRSLTTLDLPILVLGEPGTGRSTLARWAHAISERGAAPLVELDFDSLPSEVHLRILRGDQTLESAPARAGSGTLLLRHVDGLQPETWSVLSELLERQGRRSPRLLLTAQGLPTTAPPHLPTGQVVVPPLRERRFDLPVLASQLMHNIVLTPAALQVLENYNWPGNIAELRAVLLQAASLAQREAIDVRHLPESVRRTPATGDPIRLPDEGLSMEALEVSLLRQALERAGGNKTRAAELLGLTRHTLLYRLEKYGLDGQ